MRTRRTMTIQIPPGVDTGTRIQLTGEGEVGPNGGPAGDLYVEIVQAPHPVFERHGDELHCRVAVPMTSAALGTSIKLDTLDGEELLDVRPGTQSGEELLLRGKGAARLRGGQRGDLHVHLDVRVPTDLDATQRELLQQLAQLREEEAVRVTHPSAEANSGLFSRLKDAFTQK